METQQKQQAEEQNRKDAASQRGEDEKEADELLEETEEDTREAERAEDTEMTVDELERAEGEMGVPIAKDGLFEVDVKAMKLYPVFWLHRGPNIPVRRGTWFYD